MMQNVLNGEKFPRGVLCSNNIIFGKATCYNSQSMSRCFATARAIDLRPAGCGSSRVGTEGQLTACQHDLGTFSVKVGCWNSLDRLALKFGCRVRFMCMCAGYGAPAETPVDKQVPPAKAKTGPPHCLIHGMTLSHRMHQHISNCCK